MLESMDLGEPARGKDDSDTSDDGEVFGGAMFDEDAEDDYVPVQRLAS